MLSKSYGAGAGAGALFFEKNYRNFFKSLFKIIIYFSYGAGAGALKCK
jgi:hypothetical protein